MRYKLQCFGDEDECAYEVYRLEKYLKDVYPAVIVDYVYKPTHSWEVVIPDTEEWHWIFGDSMRLLGRDLVSQYGLYLSCNDSS